MLIAVSMDTLVTKPNSSTLLFNNAYFVNVFLVYSVTLTDSFGIVTVDVVAQMLRVVKKLQRHIVSSRYRTVVTE